MIPNVRKGSGFRGLLNYLLVGRQNTRIIGGNMAGRNALELTREFGICRRLRPTPLKPVMHHSLAFADNEDPGDERIAEIAEHYLRKMQLTQHQWIAVIHRDKAHVHVHLVVNRISILGKWWNATHDFERSQVVSGQIEREFGLVQVPRKRLSFAIDKAMEVHSAPPPPPPKPPPSPPSEVKHVMEELRSLLESIPHELQAPDWKREVESKGLSLTPSVGGTKISGWKVALAGHHPVNLSQVHRSLSWPKLLSSGRVIYDADRHFAALTHLKLQEEGHVPSTRSAPRTAARERAECNRYRDPESGQLCWEWQPLECAGLACDMVNRPGSLPGPSPKAPGFQVENFRPEHLPRLDASAPEGSRASATKKGPPSPSGIRGGYEQPANALSIIDDIQLDVLKTDGRPEHLLGVDSQRRSLGGSERDSGFDASRPDTWPSGSADPTPTKSGGAQSLGGGIPGGGGETGTGSRGQHCACGDLGWCGVHRDARRLTGPRVDFSDLGYSEAAIPEEVSQAARLAIQLEMEAPLPPSTLALETAWRETLWEESEEAELTPTQYRTLKDSIQQAKAHLEPARTIVRELTQAAKGQQPAARQFHRNERKPLEFQDANPSPPSPKRHKH